MKCSKDQRCCAWHWSIILGAANMDFNSYQITIDSCYSYSIVKCRRDFVGEMTRCSIQVKGFNGTNNVKWKGTWIFKLEDDNGVAHTVFLFVCWYVGHNTFCIISGSNSGVQIVGYFDHDMRFTICWSHQNKFTWIWSDTSPVLIDSIRWTDLECFGESPR